MKVNYLIKLNNKIKNSLNSSFFIILITLNIKYPKTVLLKYLSILNTIYNINNYNNNLHLLI